MLMQLKLAHLTKTYPNARHGTFAIVPALSVVVGLILAFRTNTAYDRFWEGRKLWANLDVQIRNFSRMLWVGVKDTPHSQEGSSSSSSSGSSPKRNLLHSHHLFGRSNSSLKTKVTTVSNGNGNTVVESRVKNVSSSTLIDIDSPPTLLEDPEVHGEDYEKVVCIRLLLAFAVSVKHHLRQEFGVRYFDLEALLPEGYEPCAAYETAEHRLAHDKALGDRQLHRHFNEDPWTIVSGNEDGQMSLPLEIAHGLSLWVIAQSRASRIETALVGNMLSSINSMTDIFTNMERIVFTPIPLAYSIHL
jgi:putative membrane protein